MSTVPEPASHASFSALRPRQWWDLAKRAVTAWLDDFAPSMGAALSYYTVFSIAPLLLIIIAIAGIFFGRVSAQSRIFQELALVLGPPAADSVESMLTHANAGGKSGWTAAFGVIVMLIGATTVLGELQSSLDRIWRTPSAGALNGIWGFVRTRLLSFGMILGLVFLLLVSLAVSATLAAVGAWAGGGYEQWGAILQIINLGVSFLVTTILFAMIYKLLPREHIGWRDVWVGSVVTAALFTLGKFLIGIYIGKAGVASAYGAAGSLVVLLVWVYYSAQIFLLGAEFTWVYAYAFGSRAGQKPPESTSVPRAHATQPASVSNVTPTDLGVSSSAQRGEPAFSASWPTSRAPRQDRKTIAASRPSTRGTSSAAWLGAMAIVAAWVWLGRRH